MDDVNRRMQLDFLEQSDAITVNTVHLAGWLELQFDLAASTY
jgi:hypothetical protein